MIRFAARRPFLSRRPASLTSTRKRFSVDETRRRVVLAPRSLRPIITGARDPLMRKVRITHFGTEDDQPLIGFPFSRPGESRSINRIVWWIRGTARLSEVIVHSF